MNISSQTTASAPVSLAILKQLQKEANNTTKICTGLLEGYNKSRWKLPGELEERREKREEG